jgi:hypothetical protein
MYTTTTTTTTITITFLQVRMAADKTTHFVFVVVTFADILWRVWLTIGLVERLAGSRKVVRTRFIHLFTPFFYLTADGMVV